MELLDLSPPPWAERKVPSDGIDVFECFEVRKDYLEKRYEVSYLDTKEDVNSCALVKGTNTIDISIRWQNLKSQT
jgi:hypothetical protein